jgi:hypothetical protein
LWPDNCRVELVISQGPAGEAGVKSLIGRDVSRLLRGWKRLVFGSGASMPLVAVDDRAAIDLVVRTPGALLVLSGDPPDPLPPQVRVVILPAPSAP